MDTHEKVVIKAIQDYETKQDCDLSFIHNFMRKLMCIKGVEQSLATLDVAKRGKGHVAIQAQAST